MIWFTDAAGYNRLREREIDSLSFQEEWLSWDTTAQPSMRSLASLSNGVTNL